MCYLWSWEVGYIVGAYLHICISAYLHICISALDRVSHGNNWVHHHHGTLLLSVNIDILVCMVIIRWYHHGAPLLRRVAPDGNDHPPMEHCCWFLFILKRVTWTISTTFKRLKQHKRPPLLPVYLHWWVYLFWKQWEQPLVLVISKIRGHHYSQEIKTT